MEQRIERRLAEALTEGNATTVAKPKSDPYATVVELPGGFLRRHRA
jgi:hypothetical protein